MLHQIEARILEVLDGRMSAGELSEKAGIPLGSILSFAQSLREKGFVSIESEEKKGSTFHIVLPKDKQVKRTTEERDDHAKENIGGR